MDRLILILSFICTKIQPQTLYKYIILHDLNAFLPFSLISHISSAAFPLPLSVSWGTTPCSRLQRGKNVDFSECY